MRVLWLTHTPAGASKKMNVNEPGRGWIGSLETHIRAIEGLELGICFFSNQDTEKFTQNGVSYYPMPLKYSSRAGKLYQRITGDLYDSNPADIKSAIADFKPDVIHLFGTESGVGEVVKLTNIPVVVHIQGLVNPYLYAWLPKGISQAKVFFNSSIRAMLFRRGIYFEYKLFKKRAARELDIINHAKYYFGRTNWDHNFLKLVKKDFQYFQCEEVLRPVFYETQWENKDRPVFKIVTIINPQIYKGIEIVLETAKILKNSGRIDFQWDIIGIDGHNELVQIVESIAKDYFSNYNVTFKGAMAGESLINNLLESSVFVHPSHIDNSPNSVCEAMILGLPVISGYVGGIPSLMVDKVSGIFYNSNDPYELAGKLLEASENPAILNSLSNEARKTALRRHDVNNIVNTVYSTYQSIIEQEA